jgi:DNA-binding CsgD family transcriptional regulator
MKEPMVRIPVTRAGLAEARAAVRDVLDAAGTVWLFSGPQGSGRTALLGFIAQRGRRAGRTVLTVSFAVGAGAGLERLTSLVIDRLTRSKPQVSRDQLKALRQVRADLREGAAAEPLQFAQVLSTALTALTSAEQVQLGFDDLDAAPDEVLAQLALVVDDVRWAGVTTLATFRDDGSSGDRVRELFAPADHEIGLMPLLPDEVAALLTAWAFPGSRAEPDAGLLFQLGEALGPLFGNLGTVRQSVRQLREQGRLVLFDGCLCLARSDLPIALPAAHPLLRRLAGLGEDAVWLARVVALLTAARQVTLDELLTLDRAPGLPAERIGALADELVGAGILAVSPACGALELAMPALENRLLIDAGVPWRVPFPRLPGLPGTADRGAALALGLLGRAPVSRTPADAERFIAEAARIETADQPLACRYRIAAWTLLPVGDSRRAGLLRAVIAARLALGDYANLATELAGLQPAGLPPDVVVLFFVCWFGALAHEDRLADLLAAAPPLTLLTSVVGRPGAARDLLGAMRRGDALAVAEVVRILLRFAGEGDNRRLCILGGALLACSMAQDGVRMRAAWTAVTGEEAPEETLEPVDLRDRVAALTALFPGAYRGPARGFALDHHLTCSAYRNGNWHFALSVARKIENDHPGGPPHRLAGLLAAEICVQQGEYDRAAGWLRLSAGGEGQSAHAAWVRCGMLLRTGHEERAVDQGWRDHLALSARGPAPGAELLLGRILLACEEIGDTCRREDVGGALDSVGGPPPAPSVTEAVFVFAGFARRDPDAVKAGIKLAQRAGDVFREAQACLLLGRIDPEPRRWLQQAYRQAHALEVTWLETVQEIMREKDIPLPVHETPRAVLTATDLRIAELVSRGDTNRRIASVLGVSEKRVEARLTELFKITGRSSRVELATGWLEGRLNLDDTGEADDFGYRSPRRLSC